MKRLLILVLFLCVMVIPASATDHYVSTTGSATWSQCVNISTPCAASTAMTNAVAGNTTYFLSGTYYLTTSTSNNHNPALNPSNSGTSGNPIIFKSQIQYGAIITYAASISGTGGPLIGSYNKNYITWDGFTINEVGNKSLSDTGPVVISNSDNVTIQNSDVVNVEIPARQDNHNGIRIDFSDYAVIRNNKIHGVGDVFYNFAEIMMYDSDNILIENNEIYDSYQGIFPKGGDHIPGGDPDNANGIIRYNLIHDVEAGFRISFSRDFQIYQNIIKSINWGFNFGESCFTLTCTGDMDIQVPSNLSVYNNIIYNSGRGFYFTQPQIDRLFQYGNLVKNNIVEITTYPDTSDNNANILDRFYLDYNNYYTYTNFQLSYSGYTFTNWKSITGYDTNSIITNPLFETPPTDFHLQDGSPAINAGIDFWDIDNDGNTTEPINMGVYITGDEDIGLISGEEEPPNTNYFNSTWNTSAISEGSTNATSIHLPLVSTGTYDFVVNWGETIFFLKLFSIKISFWVWIILFVAIIVVTTISIQISTSKTLISPATPTPTPATSTTTSAITVLKKIPWTAVGIVLVIILIIVAVVYSIVLKF